MEQELKLYTVEDGYIQYLSKFEQKAREYILC